MITCIHCASLLFASIQVTEKPDDDTTSSPAEVIHFPECTENLCRGMAFLIEQNPVGALNALNLAAVQTSQNDLQAIIAFCQAIAYDQLGSRDLSLQALDSLNIALIDETAPDGEIDAEISDPESHKGSEFLHRLAALSPSADIEQALHFFVGQISGELPPQILFESECRLADGENAINQGGYSKFIKRWSHILKRVSQLFELIKNIEQIFENGKGLIKE